MSAGTTRIWIAAAVLAGTWALGPLASGAGGEPAPFDPAPREGVLLLRNGETIQGKITRAGDYYVVAVPKGEIRLRAADVELACHSLEEGYRRKRADIRLGTADEHLQLGEWCQRNGLIELAERELGEAEAIDPKHPLVPVLRRRLEIARRPPQEPQRRAKPAGEPLSPENLDRLVRAMPPGSVETFTQTIQPLLMNHCTAAGCHGPQSHTRYRLLRAPAGRPAGRRVTQRNLYATLQWIDRKRPEASPLLTVPTRPHGTAKAAAFSKTQTEQYQRMVNWVLRLAQAPGPSSPVPARAGDPWPSQAMPAAADRSKRPPAGVASAKVPPPAATPTDRADPAPPANRVEKEATGPPADEASPFEGPDTGPLDDGQRRLSDPRRSRYEPPHRSPTKHGQTRQGFVPADPFDPEIFNRRFFPGKQGEP